MALAPDGRNAAVAVNSGESGTWDIWLVDLERNFRTRFTVDPSDDFDLAWGRDSRGLYFVSDRDGATAIYYKEIGSPDEPRKVFSTGEEIRLWDVSADGQTIFYSASGEGTNYDLWCADLAGKTEPRLLRRSAEIDAVSRLSPGEKWLTFGSQESGQWQVYVAPWPAMSPVTQVSTTSGTWSQWTRDGKELVFKEMSGSLVAVSMTVKDGRMAVGQPEPLFDLNPPDLDRIYWAVSADGERFLTINSRMMEAPDYCNLVLDWPEILAKR